MRGGNLLILGHGSNVNVNFGTLCIRPRGHDTNYSFCPITFKLNMYVVGDERRNPIDLGSRDQSLRPTLALYVLDLVDTIQTTVFAESLSNFIFTLWMIGGGTLLILGQGVKGQHWHSVYNIFWAQYRLQLLTSHLHMMKYNL